MIERLNTQTTPLAMTIWCLLAVVVLIDTPVCRAQIVTDGTVGPATRLNGPEMTIGAELGSAHGGNLFHSFQRFDIPTGHQATFTGPEQIRNVIGRVTGGTASNIDGTLRSTVGQADVYLINPAGVVMGPNAKVDVPAALHLSTADELRFSDGSRYSATDPAGSTLTLAAPESFGFLSPQPASLTIAGSQLELKSGKTATLTAGDVAIMGRAGRQASLRAPGGEIRIEAVGDQGRQVPVTKASERPGSGKLTIEQVRIETSGEGSGRLMVRSGEANLSDATLAADNRSHLDAAGGIDFRVAKTLDVAASRIQSNAFGTGASGGVRLRAKDLDIRQTGAPSLTGIFSEVEPGAAGASGGVDVALDGGLRIQGAAGIVGSTHGVGAAGSVRVSAHALTIDGEGATVPYRGSDYLAGIVSAANPGSSGTAGNVTVEVTGLAQLDHGAVIGSDTYTAGDAGQVRIRAGDLLLHNGAVISSNTISYKLRDCLSCQAESTGAGAFCLGGLRGRLMIPKAFASSAR